MNPSEEMREIVKSTARKNTAKIVHAFNENKKKMEETEAANSAFRKFQAEFGDIGYQISLTRFTLRQEFEEGQGLITPDDELMLRTVETLYQYFLLYERNK